MNWLRNKAPAGSKQRGRLAVGAMGLALSLGYAGVALTTLPIPEPQRAGPAAFPLLVALVLLVSSIGVVLEQVRHMARDGEEQLELPRGVDLRRLLSFGASIVGYVALLALLGHLVASSLMCVAMVRLLKPAPWRPTVVVALAISISVFVLFVLILEVPLPMGMLG